MRPLFLAMTGLEAILPVIEQIKVDIIKMSQEKRTFFAIKKVSNSSTKNVIAVSEIDQDYVKKLDKFTNQMLEEADKRYSECTAKVSSFSRLEGEERMSMRNLETVEDDYLSDGSSTEKLDEIHNKLEEMPASLEDKRNCVLF